MRQAECVSDSIYKSRCLKRLRELGLPTEGWVCEWIEDTEEPEEVCELCGRKMVIKTGRYGKFLACPGFPECKNTRRLVKDTGGLCPKCGGRVLLRRSKKGRVYYGCEKNPACDFMTWNEPTAEKCPQCGGTLFKKGGRSGLLVCEKEGCGYSRSAAEKKE